jgi:hypothetical protein
MGQDGVVALEELLSDEAMLLAGRAAPTWTADRMRSRLPAHAEQDTRPSRPALVLVCSKTDAEGVCTCDVSAGKLTWSRKTSVRKSLHLTKRRSLSKTNLLLSCKDVTTFSTTQIDESVVDR